MEEDTNGDKIKTSIFQNGREIYDTFTFEPGDEMKLAPVLSTNFRNTKTP